MIIHNSMNATKHKSIVTVTSVMISTLVMVMLSDTDSAQFEAILMLWGFAHWSESNLSIKSKSVPRKINITIKNSDLF